MSENKIFDYRDYVDTSRLTPVNFGEEIKAALAEMSQTPEFQGKLKAAYALEGNQRIVFTNVAGGGNIVQVNQGSLAIPKNAANIDATATIVTKYLSPETGQYEFHSLQGIIDHEITHKADPEIKPQNVWDTIRRTGQTLDERLMELEQRATNQTNDFASKYYGEPRRGRYQDTITLNNYDNPLVIRPLTGGKDELLPSRGTPATECAIESMQQQAPAEKAAPPNPLLACMANLSKDELAMFERTRAIIAEKPSDSSLTTQQEAGRQATPQDAIVVSQNGRDY